MALNTIGQIVAGLGWAAQNQAVISDNLARANDPGAQEKELAPLSFDQHVNSGLPTRTDEKHMVAKTHQGKHPVKEKTTQASVSISGSTINAENQLMKANVNAAHFQQLSLLYSKFTNIYRLGLK